MLFGAKHCSPKAHDGICFVLQTQYSHLAYDASNMLNNSIALAHTLHMKKYKIGFYF
jgi:hypothetical protein